MIMKENNEELKDFFKKLINIIELKIDLILIRLDKIERKIDGKPDK